VTFPRATELHDVARFVPLDRLLVETDSPFLAPVPFRGKRNEPAWVTHVAARLATLRGITTGAVASETAVNYHRLLAPSASIAETR
jgi:TatD DNase family protein